ncbi:hypothetical protein ACFUV2_17860 [Streptomyces pilosus]|uniref:hypothetical protein n=1 Tax=Streptomyces pilosus TaxID=28893 RepID=UPI003570E04F
MPAYARSRAYAHLVLRITDARTGESVDAAPARRGLTRVEAHAEGPDPTGLRVLLVADLLVRALELGGTPVWALLTGERQRAELRAAGAALGVRPFEDGGDTGAGLGEAQVLHVVGEGGAPPGGGAPPAGGAPPGGVRVAVAAVRWEAPGPPGDTDPAVLRLALLTHSASTPVTVDAAALRDARDTLARWRRAVAGWAHRPSRPVPDSVRGDLRSAWEDDLDTAGVLRVLRAVEQDPDLPEGARFETYAYADRLLGLDLTHDVGSPA